MMGAQSEIGSAGQPIQTHCALFLACGRRGFRSYDHPMNLMGAT